VYIAAQARKSMSSTCGKEKKSEEEGERWRKEGKKKFHIGKLM
jgi:hypothetical protein